MSNLRIKKTQILKDILSTIKKYDYKNYFDGNIEIDESTNMSEIVLNIIPNNGFHANLTIILTLKISDQCFPLIYVDSPIYDKLKTKNYINNQGSLGEHKGICIHKLYRNEGFYKNFKILCNNEWKNYVIYIINMFVYNIDDLYGAIGFSKRNWNKYTKCLDNNKINKINNIKIDE